MANIINVNGSKKPSNSLVSTLTAEAAHVRSGKTFIGKNSREILTGSMPNAVVITPTGKSATAKVTGLTYTYNSTNDNFTVAHSSQASATVSVQPSVSTAGYISSSEGTKTANNVTAYGQVAATVAKVGTGVDITGTTTKQPSISRTAKPSGDTWTDAASGAATTTKPTSGVYVQVNSAANTGTLTATPKVTTAGYGTTAYYGATAGTKTVGASASAATYIPITTATLPTSASSSATSGYTSKATIGRSTSAQYINIPPGYNAAGGYYTISAVANGSATTPATTISPTVSTVSLAYNSTNDNFDVFGSGSTTKSVTPTVVAGYVSSGTAGTITGSASVAATVPKIVGSVSISGTKTYKPSITRSSFSISGVTDGANGAATTTAPTSGVYVKVSSAANTGNVTAAATISTAGYGTSSNHGISGSGNVAVGASASDATYVPIKTATPAFDGGAISGSVTGITGSNVTLSDTNNGISVTGAASAGRAAVLYNGAVNGYVIQSDNATALAATSSNTTLTGKTRYITAITVPKDKVFSVTSTADTALDTTSDITITNNAYRHIKVTNNANGSTTITNSGLAYVNSSSATAGSLTVSAYNSSGNAENSKSVVTNGKWVATTVTPSGSAQGPYYGRVSVNAISSTYVGSGITARSSSDLTVSGDTVTAPAGYYASAASKSISAGTIATPTGKSATAIVTALKYTYNSTNDNFTVAHNTQASATVSVTPSVSTAGYVSSSVGTKTANNVTAYGQVNTTLAKIAGSVSISGTKTYTPSISRQAFTISGVTDAASGASTTTAPSSGVYVKVKSAASTGNVTAAATISTAGYGTASYHGITGSGNVAVGANASADTYVPIKTASPAFDGGGISGSVTGITGSNVTLSDTNNGISVTAAASATRAAVLYNGAVNGYVVKADNASALAASSATTLTGKTRYIAGITVPKDKSFSLTVDDDTALDNTSTVTINNGEYRKINISNYNTGGFVDFDNNTGSSSKEGAFITNGTNGYLDLVNDGIISGCDNNNIINRFSNNTSGNISALYNEGVIQNLENKGTITYKLQAGYTATLGSLTVNYTDDNNQSWNIPLIQSGNWLTQTVTPSMRDTVSNDTDGPYYGKVYVDKYIGIPHRVLIARKSSSTNSYTDALDTLSRATEIKVNVVLGGNTTGGKWYIQYSGDGTNWTTADTYSQYSSAGYVRGTEYTYTAGEGDFLGSSLPQYWRARYVPANSATEGGMVSIIVTETN